VNDINHPDHVYQLLSVLAKDARSYFCIGVQEGNCLLHVIRANPDLEYLALCDTWGPHHGGTGRGNHNHIARMLDAEKFVAPVEWLDGSSSDLVPRLVARGAQFDLTFVDGDHSFEGASIDLQNTWPLTRKVLVLHDTEMPPVRQALDAFLADHHGVPHSIFHYGTGTTVIYKEPYNG
jgi:hypothetical protein